MCRSVCICLLSVAAASAYAFEWPDSGTAEVPAGETATVSDDDLAAVANLDAIVLGDGASVTAQALSSPLCLKASVSGGGNLVFVDCLQGVELTGDNSALTGRFVFTNSAVTVAARHALGGVGTPGCDFAKGASGTFSFVGGGLTNDVPLVIYGAGVAIPHNDAGAVMVQTTNLFFDVVSGGGVLTLRNFHMTGGTFRQGGARGYYYLKVADGYTTRFGKDVTVDVGLTYFTGTGRLQFDARPKSFSLTHLFPGSENTLVFGCENVFSETSSWSAQLGSKSSGYGIDLNGYNQKIKFISGAWYTPAYGSALAHPVYSETPATLAFTAATNDRTLPLKFLGQASFDYGGVNGAVYRLVNVQSDTTGGLTVSSGTLSLEWNYGWNGTNVLVRSGATLNIDTLNAITSGKARLVIEPGGTIDVNGNSLVVASASLGGVELEKNAIYSAERIAELCPGIVWGGTGALTVMPEAIGDFEWPAEQGAVAEIPIAVTVAVSNENVSSLSGLSGIRMGGGSELVFSGLTEPFEFDIPLSGFGVVSFKDCAGCVITANNTNFLGHFEFENTSVVVSNRFALGCAASEPTWFVHGSGTPTFSFLGGGLTNDVALVLDPSGVVIPYGTDETLVQNAGLRIPAGTSSEWLKVRNLRMTRGGLVQDNLEHVLYVTVAGGCRLTLESDVVVDIGNIQAQGGSGGKASYCIATTNMHCSWYTHYNYGADLQFGAENVFRAYGEDTAFPVDLGIHGTDHGIYLNGFDQYIREIYYGVNVDHPAITEGDVRRVSVYSDKPAILTMPCKSTNLVLPIRFMEKAGLRYIGEEKEKGSGVWGRYQIANQVSETEGSLTVESGTLSFKWGAAWCGTNVTVNGGILEIDATAQKDFFNKEGATGRSRTSLNVSGEGKISLGDGIETRVGYLVVDGTEMPRGVYGGPVAGLDEAHTLSCFTGAGTVKAQRSSRCGLMVIIK